MSFGERFLVHPDLFPARLAGEPVGEERVVIRVADEVHAIDGLSPEQAEGLRERFRGFLDEAHAPQAEDVTTRVLRMAPDEFRSLDTRGWDYDLDLEHGAAFVKIAGLRLAARLAWRERLTGAFWTAASDAEFPGAFENYLRVLVAYGLLERGGLLVHSAGIVSDDGAHVFAGVSGAGKSTLSRLSQAEGRRVLSDDLNALLPRGSGFSALAVPFAGDLRGDSDTGAHPLRAVVRLIKGAGHELRAASRGATVAALAACSPYVNRDPFRAERLMANLATIVAAVDCQELSFALHPGVWDAIAVRA